MNHEKSSAPTLRQIDLREYDGGNNRGLPTLEQILDYQREFMAPYELAAMFQPMIDSGVIWHFPQDFKETAAELLDKGHCRRTIQPSYKNVFYRPPTH